MFFLHTDIKSTSIWRKIEVHVESISFCSSYEHFQLLQRNKQHKTAINLGGCRTSRYKLLDSFENIVRHFVTSLWR